MQILIAVIVFGLVITVHELGHFAAAKLCGIRVNKFAIGMGPAIFKRKKGETEYSLRLFPIGGYCAMDEDEDNGDERSFRKKSVWRRMAVILAGAVMNLLLGLVLNIILISADEIIVTTRIEDFRPDASSYSSGLRIGDKITKIDGMIIFTDEDISYKLSTGKSNSFDVEVIRGGKRILIEDVSFGAEYRYRYAKEAEKSSYEPLYVYDITENAYKKLGAGGTAERMFYFDGELNEYVRLVFDENYTNTEILEFKSNADFYPVTEENSASGTLGHSFKRTATIGQVVWCSLIDLLRGRYSLNDMSGLVGVTSAIDQVITPSAGFGQNLLMVINITILITINLGVFNLLPFPALDGGRFIFLLLEAVRRKPVPAEKEGMVHFIGMALLFLLIIFVTFNDIRKLFTGG